MLFVKPVLFIPWRVRTPTAKQTWCIKHNSVCHSGSLQPTTHKANIYVYWTVRSLIKCCWMRLVTGKVCLFFLNFFYFFKPTHHFREPPLPLKHSVLYWQAWHYAVCVSVCGKGRREIPPPKKIPAKINFNMGATSWAYIFDHISLLMTLNRWVLADK